ncbi:MAG: type II 3-dehydroquinate dehydratase [Pseudomonadota bacterium]|nr:MAG: type II 3-dehydroquinate dehydratase [Pseudomonadota bacterium]
MNVLVLHGPNLNLLGEREPELYGRTTLAELDRRLVEEGARLGLTVRCFQSNHEGALIDAIHEARRWMQAIVINAGAYTHTSYALRDAIAAVRVPAIEVHLTDIEKREPWRRNSVLADVCQARFMGKGVDSYLEALVHVAKALRQDGRAS